MARLLRILLALSVASGAAWAETPPSAPASDWGTLARLPAGRCVALITTDQSELKVRLIRWDEKELVVQAGRGKMISFPKDSLYQVGEYKRCNSAKVAVFGGLIGFTAGFAAMAVGTQSLCVDCEPGESGLLGAVAVGAAVGVISAIVSARSTDQPVRWLYRKP